MLRRSLMGLLVLAGLGGVAAAADQAQWRESRGDPQQDAYWRSIEGQPMNDLAPLNALSGWINPTPGNAAASAPPKTWDDLKGKVIVLDLWATWCPPCVAGIPELVEMHKKYADQGLVVLGAHLADGSEAMAEFAAMNKLPYLLAVDKNQTVSQKLMASTIPCYFVVDRDGVLRVACADRGKLEEIVVHYLAQKPSANTGAIAANPTFPPALPKRLYASNDLRGKPAPALEPTQWLTDKPDTAGKITLWYFWTTWSPQCRSVNPQLLALQQKFADRLVVVGISAEEADTITKFTRDNNLGFAQAIDAQRRLQQAVGVEGVPLVLLVSTDGLVRWQGYPLDPTDPLTEALVGRVIAADPGSAGGKAPPMAQPKSTNSSTGS